MVRASTVMLVYWMMQRRRNGRPYRPARSYTHIPPAPKATPQELTTLFNMLDENGDGFIDLEEFKIFNQFVFKYKIFSVETQFNRADYNKDGKISLEEWLRFGKENPPRSSTIQSLIKYLPIIQCGFSEIELETTNRRDLFRLSKHNGLSLDACTSNAELREELKKLLQSKSPKQSWSEWLTSFW